MLLSLRKLNTSQRLLRDHLICRRLSSRARNVLSSLDFSEKQSDTIPGVYDGEWRGSGEIFESVCPSTREVIGRIRSGTPDELQATLSKTREAYRKFRLLPPPRRGEIVRQIRNALSSKVCGVFPREELGALVALEMGKIRTEGVGEVQEFIDICDYAVGLSRMMNGRLVASERPGHSILEVPNPLGVVGVLSAFNFPVAVYGWNLAISMVAGNATLWKPSPSTPLCSIAITKIVSNVLENNGLPGAIAGLFVGGKDAGEAIVESEEVDLVSFTGSEAVGRQVGKVVQGRFGKIILELGGNNASIVLADADLNLALPAVFFGAVGTAGQRCTTTRRLFIQRAIASTFIEKLQAAYKSITPGDPLIDGTLLGPLHTERAISVYLSAIDHLRFSDAEILIGGRIYEASHLEDYLSKGYFVQPTIAIPRSTDPKQMMWSKENFAPILNVAVFDEVEEAIEWNNAVPQGLSSTIWTRDIRNIGKWIGPEGSDCGIVNVRDEKKNYRLTLMGFKQVNVGTSGAEIGAAFGGNKSTGWGRESGGDAWKQYVRWSACTINYSDAAPLAQGVNFNLPSS
ncbi:hypothetical protein Clacol_008773 [Clathrus columnatus]|uniref:aldehyde dehydrogenase (NAD(+)) n=1 Tax=Clathrus columnatus TaxID=1419009 RepID=A0AAV5AMZ7_9AGAM|nr:hypothetical protein Clacol_008773 [Clathrus columnatus]